MYICTFILNICPAYAQVFIVDESNISQVNVLCDSKQTPNESSLKPSRHCRFSHEVHESIFGPGMVLFQLLAYVRLAPFQQHVVGFGLAALSQWKGENT